jgi:hypothetical protein
MKFIALTLAAVLAFSLTSCDRTQSAEQKQSIATEKLLAEVNNKIGMPNIKNFQQKKLMRLIQEQCDREDLVCYAYLQSALSGKLVFVGKCIGFGVPFSAQFTNPETLKKFNVAGGWHREVMPQADPNGLYMPTSSSATWLMMIDPKSKEPRPVYFEPTITVSPFPLPSETAKD